MLDAGIDPSVGRLIGVPQTHTIRSARDEKTHALQRSARRSCASTYALEQETLYRGIGPATRNFAKKHVTINRSCCTY